MLGILNIIHIFSFGRQGQFLNVRGEKTSESLFYEVLRDTVAQWSGVKLLDYCCAESITVEDAGIKGEADICVYIHITLMDLKSVVNFFW